MKFSLINQKLSHVRRFSIAKFLASTVCVCGAVVLPSMSLMPIVSTPAYAQSAYYQTVDGFNVKRVEYQGGVFQQQADGSWIETAGNAQFTFQELNRTQGIVYLLKEDGARIRLDLRRNKIVIHGIYDLYDIVAVSNVSDAIQPVVDGLNVRQVAYADGMFRQVTDSSWIEWNENGEYMFREVGRSETSVSLIKEDGARILLDLRRNKIRYNRRDLYDITEVSDFSEFMLVTSWSVRQVGYRGGLFQQLDDGSWIERNENGEYTFRELSRDENSVYLLKEDGDRIRLDLNRGKIIANGRFELYDITSLSSIVGRG